MSHSSYQFLLALAPALLVYYAAPARFRLHVLLACSCLFCLASSPLALAVPLALAGVVHLLGRRMAACPAEEHKRWLLRAGLLLLLGTLCLFKYAPPIAGALAGRPTTTLFAVAAPIGLSYYTFKLIGYLVDVYWEKTPAEPSFVKLALYASWFPELPSGPIQRAEAFLSQLDTPAPFSAKALGAGLRWILFGLFKKAVVADRLGAFVDAAFASPSCPSSVALVASYAFTLQLFADFSAATDIAIGMGRLFGIASPPNFDAPFQAKNIQDFWRRWHMTLSSWLADYVFTPLRMRLRRLDDVGLVIAILVDMTAIGLWHGARWTFVLFGLLNGVYMAVSALTLKRRNRFFRARPGSLRARAFAGPFVVFHMMALAFTLFRAETVAAAGAMTRGALRGVVVLGLRPGSFATDVLAFARAAKISGADLAITLFGVAVMQIGHALARQPRVLTAYDAAPLAVRWAVYYALALLTVALGQLAHQRFIYAQF